MLADGTSVASTSVPVRTITPLASSWRVTASNSARYRSRRTRSRRTSSRRKRTKAVRSGVGSCAAKPRKRRKLARSSSASASRTSERSCQVASSRARKRASGGQPSSPFAAAEMPTRWRSISVQSRSAASSVNEGDRGSGRAMRSSCPIRRRAMPASVIRMQQANQPDRSTSNTSAHSSRERLLSCSPSRFVGWLGGGAEVQLLRSEGAAVGLQGRPRLVQIPDHGRGLSEHRQADAGDTRQGWVADEAEGTGGSKRRLGRCPRRRASRGGLGTCWRRGAAAGSVASLPIEAIT